MKNELVIKNKNWIVELKMKVVVVFMIICFFGLLREEFCDIEIVLFFLRMNKNLLIDNYIDLFVSKYYFF